MFFTKADVPPPQHGNSFHIDAANFFSQYIVCIPGPPNPPANKMTWVWDNIKKEIETL